MKEEHEKATMIIKVVFSIDGKFRERGNFLNDKGHIRRKIIPEELTEKSYLRRVSGGEGARGPGRR